MACAARRRTTPSPRRPAWRWANLRDPAYVQPPADLIGKGGFFKKRSPDEIRAAAAIALGTIGDPRAVPVLEKTAMDQNVMVRSSAERALRRLRGEPTLE